MEPSQALREPTAPRKRCEAERFWLSSHVVLCVSGLLLWVYFFLLNRTTVAGRRALSIRPDTLLVSNHQSSMDSFLIAIAVLFPHCLARPWMMPWNLAAEEFYFRTPLQRWFARRLRCIPVRRELDGSSALRRLRTSIRHGVGIFYPEGRRSPDGSVGAAGPGVGVLILAARPCVIPVAIEGLQEAVRFERFGLRFFRRIGISIGEPIQFAAATSATGSQRRREARRAADDVMDRVRRLHAELRGTRKRA